MVSIDTAYKIGEGAAKGLKKFSASDWWRRWREKRSLDLLSCMHNGFAHSSRCLAMQMMQKWDTEHLVASRLAIEVCTTARDAMAKITGSSPLHCCLKTMVTENADYVGTWARSTPPDGRPLRDDGPHAVADNSVWSALLGKADKGTVWPPALTCFACNDLPGQKAKFKCDRENWQNYYQSVLVFPMRYAKSSDGNVFGRVGFLAFDSPKTNAFKGLPNIFDYTDRPGEYVAELHRTSAFHLGALFADTLGTFLGAAYEAHNNQGSANVHS